MKRALLFIALLLSVAMYAAKEDTYLLYTGFEGGAIPEGWTQETVVGNRLFTVEKGDAAINPEGAFAGDYRLLIRNESGQTDHAVTRLYTPVLHNLDQSSLPLILIISHAQMHWTGDVDELRIYYRNSLDDNAKWIPVEGGEFTTKVQEWRTDTLPLTGYSTGEYQLCFEVTDNMGRGVVLDDVIIRPEPSCFTPELSTSGLTGQSATISWTGSDDALNFHFILATEDASNPEKISEKLIDKTFIGDTYSYATGTVLETNTTYYAFVKSICDNEESDWGKLEFTTQSFFPLPYTETFNMPAATNMPMAKYWTRGTNIEENLTLKDIPFVNTNKGASYLYRYSPSETTGLVFASSCDNMNADDPLPAYKYAYAATPELGITNIKDVEVSFWGTANDGAGNINSIIVGAMSDPKDYKTFVPADTITLANFNCIEHFVVYFDKLNGENLKYVAFVSDFNKTNLFYIDDVEIREVANVTKVPTNVVISNINPDGFTVNANLNGSKTCDVYITNTVLDKKTDNEIIDLELLEETDIYQVVKGVSLPYNFTFDKDLRNEFVQVFVVANGTNGNSQNAFPIKIHVPNKMTGTYMLVDFDEKDNGYPIWHASEVYNYYRNDDVKSRLNGPSNTMYYSKNILVMPNAMDQWPKIQSRNGNARTTAFDLSSAGITDADGNILYDPSYSQYIVLGKLDKIDDVTLSFYVSATNLKRTKKVPSVYVVGMMTDPYDISTFDTLQTAETTDQAASTTGKLTYVEIPLASYKGEGRYPAIMAGQGKTAGKDSYGNPMWSNIYVDEFMVATPDKCMDPKNVKVVSSSITAEGATLSWDKGNMSEWQVTVSLGGTVVVLDTVNEPTYTVKGLLPDTKYDALVSTVCTLDGGVMDGPVVSFTTTCAPFYTIPFFENFDARETQTVPQCWRSKNAGTIGDMQSKRMWQLGTGASSAKPLCYIQLPLMDPAIAINKLQFSFDTYISTAEFMGAKVYAVVMDDEENMDTLKTFVSKKYGSYEHCIISLRNYTGTGKYLAIVRDAESAGKEIRIDNVAVDLLPQCEAITGTNAFNPTTSGATIEWYKGDATEWQVLVTKEQIDLSEEVKESDVVAILKATTMPYVITDVCEPGTDYYVAVRSVCDKNTMGEWSEYASFQTQCLPTTPEAFGVEDFSDANVIKCWTVGTRVGDDKPTIASGALYISNKAKAAYDGAYAFLPMMDVNDISKYQVSFLAHGGTNLNSLHQLSVGIATIPNGNMTVMKTVDLNVVTKVGAFNEGKRYVVRFNNYTGDIDGVKGKYIGFMSNSGELANDIYIDDVQVSLIPECWEPSVLKVDTVTNNSVTLAWENVEETSYEVTITKMNGTVVKTDIVTPSVVADTIDITHTITGLAGHTTYKALVRSICAGGKSEYAPAVTFSTDCPDITPLPYEECFDYNIIATAAPYTGVDCWQTWTLSNDTVFAEGTAQGAYAYVSTSAQKDSKAGLYIGSTFGSKTTKPCTSYAVLPTFGVSAKQLRIEFDYSLTAANAYGFLAIGAATDVSTPKQMKNTTTWLDTIEVPYVSTKEWYHYAANLDNYTGAGEHIIICAFNGNKSGTTVRYFCIDNVFVETIPTCYRPKNTTMVSNTATSLEFTWTPSGEETQWDIICIPSGDEITLTGMRTVNTTNATFENLNPSTDYDIYVRANCGGGDVSSWSHVATMTTLCRTDFSGTLYNFDDPDDRIPNLYPKQYSESSYPDWDGCWMQGAPFEPTNKAYYNSAVPRMTGTYQKTYALYATSDLYAIELGTETPNNYDGGYMVSPEVAGDLDTMQVSFWMRAGYTKIADGSNYTTYSSDGYARSIKVGTMTDPTDFTTFELLADVQTAKMEVAPDPEGLAYWRHFDIPLYHANGKYVVLLSQTYPEKNIVYVDDIEFGHVTGVPMPTAVKADYDKLSYNHIELVWKSALSKFQVTVRQNGEFIKEETVTTTSYVLDGLNAGEEFQFTVEAINDAGEKSVPVTVKVTTPCKPTDQYNAYWDFHSDLEQFGSSSSYMIPACWTVGCLSNKNNDGAKPNAQENTGSYIYARGDGKGTSERALRFNTTTSNYGQYAIMPELDIDLTGMAIEFYMRNGYASASSNQMTSNNSTYTAANGTLSCRDITIGYIVNNDINTFVPVATETYGINQLATMKTSDDPDCYWQKKRVPLGNLIPDGVNKFRLVFMYNKDVAKAGVLCIDDVSIVSEEGCSSVSSFKVEPKSTSAAFSWKSDAESYRVQVATDKEFNDEDIVINEIVENATSYTATGLNQGTNYYVRVQSYCSVTDASPFVSSSFVTYCAPRYVEDFSQETITPANWWRAGWTYEDANADLIMAGLKDLPTDKITETSENIWQHDNDRGDMYVCNMLEDNQKFAYAWWLLSPVFDFTANAQDSLLFSLDVALEARRGHGDPNPVETGDVFAIYVSLDGGQNWFAEDMICNWQNKKGAKYSYNSLKKTPTRYYIDITKFAGKKVTFGFYSASTANGDSTSRALNVLRIDNIQVNTFNTKIDKQTACQWEDFQDEYFTVYGDDAKVGVNTAEKYSLSTEDGVSDKLVKLQLTVTPAAITNQNYRICEGEDYTNDNFNIKNVTSSNIYKQKLGGTSTCDSLVVLDLSVIPTQTGDVEATICSGTYYEFGGEKYYTSQPNLTKTFKSVEGCDSIVTLHLTVNPIIEGEMQEIYLCEGSEYILGTQTITEAGEYTETLSTADGCDSIAKVKVIMAPVYNTSIRTAICHGSKYPYAPFENMSVQGTYTSESTSQYGCDSTITLRLLVADIDNVIYDTIAETDLPYMVNDSIILPVGTARGSHDATITLDCGVTNMVIQVGESVGLGKIESNTLSVPNPVMVGQDITVLTDFTAAQLSDMTLEVFSSTGMLVYNATPKATPIVIPGMLAAGMYNVRITTGESVYNAKLIVR